MMAFFRRMARKKFIPSLWTVITIALLCLPGSALPSGGLFNIPQLDKVAHIILFGGIVLLWGLHFTQTSTGSKPARSWAWLVVGNIVLGVILEFIQRDYIPNRSFDVGDILADAAGSVLVFIILVLWLKRHGENNLPQKSKPL